MSFSSEKLLEVSDICKHFSKKKAVTGISFSIRENEIFGLVGPNGAGKTTTLRMVATLLKPDAGQIELCGVDVAAHPDEARRFLSYLPEDAGVYRNLTGWQYLEFIARFFGDARKAREIAELGADMSGLGERLHDRVSTYSKGMTRKLVIARALMARPRLAILDEPASGLDLVSAMAVRERIREAAVHGAVLLSSHNLFEVESLCHRVALVYEGRIAACGTPEELRRQTGRATLEEAFLELVRNPEAPREA